jgi:hypothetical protein
LIINMTEWDEERVRVDNYDRKLQRSLVGNNPEIIDCGAEQSAQQLSEYFWRARAEHKTPDYLMQYVRSQAAKALPGEMVTDPTGLEIAARSRPENLSNLALGDVT